MSYKKKSKPQYEKLRDQIRARQKPLLKSRAPNFRYCAKLLEIPGEGGMWCPKKSAGTPCPCPEYIDVRQFP